MKQILSARFPAALLSALLSSLRHIAYVEGKIKCGKFPRELPGFLAQHSAAFQIRVFLPTLMFIEVSKFLDINCVKNVFVERKFGSGMVEVKRPIFSIVLDHHKHVGNNY